MAEYRYNEIQTVAPGGSVIFSNDCFPCTNGTVIHQNESGTFIARGIVRNPYASVGRLHVHFGANVAIPTGSTVGEISLAISVGGSPELSTTMLTTPAAVEVYDNVNRSVELPIYRGVPQYISVTNTSDVPILVQNAIIDLDRIA